MKIQNVIFASLAVSGLFAQTAFAQNLGALGENEKPQSLLSADQFLNINSGVLRGESDVRYRHRSFNRYRRYPHYYYPYNYYYPSYYYYPNYYYPYGSYYSDRSNGSENENSLDQARVPGDRSQTEFDASQLPVVCFASDASGSWYAIADAASNAQLTQTRVNQECLGSGLNSCQNLGCAFATDRQ